MSDNKTYYYMRLHENFYEREDMKVLQSMRDGYLYTDILMKLSLKSLKYEGRLMFKENIPYDAEIISTITGHRIETVENAIKIFEKFKWIEILGNGAIYILDIQDHVGRTSSEGDRKRRYRRKIENEKNFIRNSDDKVMEVDCESCETDYSVYLQSFEAEERKIKSCEIESKEIENSEKTHEDLRKDIINSENENFCKGFNEDSEIEGLKESNNVVKDTFYKMGQNRDICPPEKEKNIKIKKEKKRKYNKNHIKNNNTRKNETFVDKSNLLKEVHDIEKDEYVVVNVLKHFEKCGFIISSRLAEFVKADITIYGEKYLMDAANVCVKRGKLNNYSYLTGILQNWRTKGYNGETSSYKAQSKCIGYTERSYCEVKVDKKINHAAYSPMRSILDEQS